MFQYAAGLALAMLHRVPLLIDTVDLENSRRSLMLDRFCIPERIITSRRVPRIPGAAWLAAKAGGYDYYEESGFHYDEGLLRRAPPVILKGYFQSWQYSSAIEAELRERFRLKAPLSSTAARFHAKILEAGHSVSVHLRRGDYMLPANNQVHGTLGRAYYDRALKVVRALSPKASLFLFSDEPELATRSLFPDTALTVVTGLLERPWEEMLLMAACKSHIIANSSFSWWGAWLDENPEKLVVAPRQWFSKVHMRKANTCDLLPDEAILV